MTKVNRAKEFLEQKDKVVFSVIFRGRENAHVDEGFKPSSNRLQPCTAAGSWSSSRRSDEARSPFHERPQPVSLRIPLFYRQVSHCAVRSESCPSKRPIKVPGSASAFQPKAR
jgi:hypothetical protein